tara:strand:- start:293 stop:478 length:186 start_codon:yes stop_codon:yes gene_type:complete
MMADVKIKMSADDLSQAIGEYLYNRKKLPVGMEEASVGFKVEDGEFIITVSSDKMPSVTLN